MFRRRGGACFFLGFKKKKNFKLKKTIPAKLTPRRRNIHPKARAPLYTRKRTYGYAILYASALQGFIDAMRRRSLKPRRRKSRLG